MIFFIAKRYLFPFVKDKNNKKISLKPSISAVAGFLGLFLSVATLIIVCSVFNGFKTEFIKTIIGINSYISLDSFEGKITNYKDVIDNISSDKNLSKSIKNTYPTITGQVMIISDTSSTGIIMQGFNKQAFLHKKILQNSIVKGNLEDIFDNTEWKIILGIDLAASLKVNIGDYVKIISPSVNNTIFGSIPIHKEFKVGGIFNLRMSHYDSNFAFIPLEFAKRFFDYEQNQVKTIEVDINPSKINQVQNYLMEKFKQSSIYSSTYQERNASYINAIKMQSAVINIILSLFVILAIFIVFWVIKIMINEKTKEIATLQTMGYTQKDINIIFYTTGMIICLSGIAIGNIFGILFALNIDSIRLFLESFLNIKIFDSSFYFLSYLPSVVYIKDVLIINLFCIASTIIALHIAIKSIKNVDASILTKF